MIKTTLATFKAYVRTCHKAGNLHVKQLTCFDPTDDSVHPVEDEFRKVDQINMDEPHTLGIQDPKTRHGLWLVGDGRDYFETYEDDKYYGYRVSNCCGSAIIAMDFTTK